MQKDITSVKIHSYKHNKAIHRVWNNISVLDVKDHEVVVANYKTRVVESNGAFWNTREPAICFFYDDKWYNIIAMMKKDGIHYYCNISSPYLYDGEAIKYIDYDLDLRVDNNYHYKILDRKEYRYHAELMGYSAKLQEVIEHSLQEVIELVKKKEGPFDHQLVLNYLKDYQKINHNVKGGETDD